MSTDDPSRHPGHVGQASPLLFSGLVDDAAVFPPGNATVPLALAEHRLHREAGYADAVGPLLVRASQVSELVDLLAGQSVPEPVRVGVICADGVTAAREALSLTPAGGPVQVVGIELPLATLPGGADLAPTWDELAGRARSVWWEVETPAGPAGPAGSTGSLERIAAAARSGRLDGRGGAKLRTGGVTPDAFPSEGAVAAFLRRVIDLDLSFKLTAGLHHAVRQTDADGGLERHGVLNILCAVRSALNGAEEPELETLLSERDPAPLVTRTHGMSDADASVVRAFWSSFGCCGVTDPLDELTALGVLLPR
jgi:hypothetical protein